MRRRELVVRKLRTLRTLPWFVIGWLAPAWIMIGLAAAAIAVVPFRRLAALYGQSLGTRTIVPTANAAQRRRAALIGKTIGIAARYAPFRSDCYPQALTAALMCRFHHLPYALYFGLAAERRDGTALPVFNAHAWVTSGPVTMTGGAGSFVRYRVVSCFVTRSVLPG